MAEMLIVDDMETRLPEEPLSQGSILLYNDDVFTYSALAYSPTSRSSFQWTVFRIIAHSQEAWRMRFP